MCVLCMSVCVFDRPFRDTAEKQTDAETTSMEATSVKMIRVTMEQIPSATATLETDCNETTIEWLWMKIAQTKR